MDPIVRLQLVLSGALVLGAAVIGLYFLRFWRRARDGLFLHFAIAFWLLSINWLLGAFVFMADETQWCHYTVRLAAFAVIIWGVWKKNRSGRCA